MKLQVGLSFKGWQRQKNTKTPKKIIRKKNILLSHSKVTSFESFQNILLIFFNVTLLDHIPLVLFFQKSDLAMALTEVCPNKSDVM